MGFIRTTCLIGVLFLAFSDQGHSEDGLKNIDRSICSSSEKEGHQAFKGSKKNESSPGSQELLSGSSVTCPVKDTPSNQNVSKRSHVPDSQKEADYGALSGNPAAVNLFNGTGKLGEYLGIAPETGVQLGGLWIGNSDLLMSGAKPGNLTFNSLEIIDLQVDLEKFKGIDGASFAATFLQFDGSPSNQNAGVIVGYNGLTEAAPLNRSELYQLWWRQKLFEDKLIFRIGKSVPYADFNNIIKAIPIDRERSPPYVPAVSALIFAPIFVNPSVLGVMPGYYNSAWGATVHFVPNDYYMGYGAFDGSLARGKQTGDFAFPTFNQYYFNIGELGKVWGGNYPGKIAFGGWGQSGSMCANQSGANEYCTVKGNVTQSGAHGFYGLATNRLLSLDVNGQAGAIVGFMQYGINNSVTMMANQFVGGGLSAFGVIPNRLKDSIGVGFGISYLNPVVSNRTDEVVTQMYYQSHVFGDVYFQPVFSYVPHPAAIPQQGSQFSSYPSATSLILEMIALF